METSKYLGGLKLINGFLLGFVVTISYLTFTSDSGYYSVLTLLKYSGIAGGVVGFINFVLYESSSSDMQKAGDVVEQLDSTSGYSDGGSSGCDSGGQ
ncbi:hypothetical protein J7384_15845 [Endozoicomonas sp. G2_1]|uniref:hypothetical protein n=1 Tax=Endozoicomonas sp. G2_1 TaxID=2821091 RepID=UPI001AD9534A|nr:hypothetical protein [Endozoicomonas sp. G2_1]MBO9491832.1 hypothetical protein [Endozoicomonas sp. G2_1]